MAPAVPPDQNRRRLLRRAVQWLTALVALALLYPLKRFLGHTIAPKPRHVRVAAPLPLAGYHLERDFILFAPHGQTPYAVSRICTHLGCRVNFLEDKGIIECPCHQSRFSPQGQRLAGPAKKNLAVYPVEVQADEQGTVTGYVVTL